MSQTTISGNNRFVFVCPMWNAHETLARMLHSLYGQSYDNWRLILIDDVSHPAPIKLEKRCIDQFRMFDTKINRVKTIWNDEKKWEVANVLVGIQQCEDNDVICRIDADDFLCELDALAMINHTYEQTNCDCLWTAHRWSFSDKNISGPMPDDANPYVYPWVSSHLKTFRKRLINDVNDQNFRGENGEYIKRAGDQAVYLPILHQAKKRVFLPRVTYHYNIKDVPETYQTSDAAFQRDEAIFLRMRGYVK